MKKILTTSLFCAAALLMSACSSENKELSKDTFKFSIKKSKDRTGWNMETLTLTAKDDIEIKKITANRGRCSVRDRNLSTDEPISEETPKVCYEDVLYTFGYDCRELIKWAQMSKEDCNYKYVHNYNKETGKEVEKVEKTDDKKYIESCEKAKKIAKENYNGKYFYDYKRPMKFGMSSEFYIYNTNTICPSIIEFTVYTNKGYVTYSVN